MHQEAFQFVQRYAAMLPGRHSVCELGSRDVNGSVRPLFASAACYLGIDTAPGPGVDLVADAADGRPQDGQRFDTVVSTECLEHTSAADKVCQTAYEILDVGGVFLVTAAGVMRAPHSGVDGGRLRAGEWYANITAADLREWLKPFAVALVDDFSRTGDIYAFAVQVR